MKGIRPWSEEGASFRELALIEASERECPDASSLARALEAALAAVPAGTTGEVATSETTRAPQPGVGKAGTVTGFGVVTKAIGIVLVAVTIAMGAFAWRRFHVSVVGALPRTTDVVPVPSLSPVPESELSRVPSASASAPASVSEAPTSPVTLESRTHRAESSGAAPFRAPSAPKPVPPGRRVEPSTPASPFDGGLDHVNASAADAASSADSSDENVLLEQAWRALASDPRSTIGLLDRYESRFPAGNLSAEAGLLRVKALLALGADVDAAAAAEAFCRAHPQSPYVGSVQALIRATTSDRSSSSRPTGF